jgi:hypothetical protein
MRLPCRIDAHAIWPNMNRQFQSKARCESRGSRQGETIDGHLYKTSLPIQVGATLSRSFNQLRHVRRAGGLSRGAAG